MSDLTNYWRMTPNQQKKFKNKTKRQEIPNPLGLDPELNKALRSLQNEMGMNTLDDEDDLTKVIFE